MNEKMCTQCLNVKPVTEFHKDKDKGNGLRSSCKECGVACAAAYQAAHKEEIAARKAAYQAAHKEEGAAYTARRRARKRAAPTENFTDADIRDRHGTVCYLCGLDTLPANRHRDHVIPLVDYGAHILANVRFTHDACNLRKGRRHVSELDWVQPGALAVEGEAMEACFYARHAGEAA